jgi:hypothetical protein
MSFVVTAWEAIHSAMSFMSRLSDCLPHVLANISGHHEAINVPEWPHSPAKKATWLQSV